MPLGRVIGTMVPYVVYEGLQGVPMLFVQPLYVGSGPKRSLFQKTVQKAAFWT